MKKKFIKKSHSGYFKVRWMDIELEGVKGGAVCVDGVVLPCLVFKSDSRIGVLPIQSKLFLSSGHINSQIKITRSVDRATKIAEKAVNEFIKALQ